VSPRWGVFVDPGTRWIPLELSGEAAPAAPLDPLELALRPPAGASSSAARPFAERVVAELGGVPDPHALVEQVVGFVDRAERVGALAAAVLPSEALDEVVVYLEILLVPSAVLPADLAALERSVAADGATWSETARVDTPAGPAVRLHLIDADPRGTQSLVATESVWHLVPTPDASAVAVVASSWTDLTQSELYAEIADLVAATLVLEPEPVS
jgi:hypothetical protein